jgi:hypothetical protein
MHQSNSCELPSWVTFHSWARLPNDAPFLPIGSWTRKCFFQSLTDEAARPQVPTGGAGAQKIDGDIPYLTAGYANGNACAIPIYSISSIF